MVNYVLVVGNKFEEFAKNNDFVMTKSEFIQQFSNGSVQALDSYSILIGQGISPDDMNLIQEKIEGTKYNVLTDLVLSSEKESDLQKTVHKHKKENIMISPPSRIGRFSYLSSLNLRDSCAELSDHMTGQHIQGINLIEGARQLMLSVSELFILEKNMKFNSYFVLNSIETEFKKFVFPMEVSMLLRLSNLEYKKRGSISAESECEFTQNGEHVATVKINFSTYDKDFIGTKESELASEACKNHYQIRNIIPETFYAI